MNAAEPRCTARSAIDETFLIPIGSNTCSEENGFSTRAREERVGDTETGMHELRDLGLLMPTWHVNRAQEFLQHSR